MEKHLLEKKILRHAGRAIAGFNMTEEGDRILVALSEDKDSLVLRHALIESTHLLEKKC